MQLTASHQRSCALLTPRHLWPLLVWFLVLEDPQIDFFVESRTQWAGFCIGWFKKTEKDDTISATAEGDTDFETTTDEEEEEEEEDAN